METKKMDEVMKLALGSSSPELSARSSAEIVKNENDESFISVYSGELTMENLTECIANIKASFPALPVEFYTMLARRLKDNGFNDDRLKDAVNHVIDNCIYPTPTIAQFVSFDKKRRLYTYNEMLKMVNDSNGDANTWSYFDKKEINGKVYWIRKDD